MSYNLSRMSDDEPKKRRRGRPRKRDTPIPWETIDRLLINGQRMKDVYSGLTTTRFPSYGEIARRFNCAKSSVSKYSSSRNCMERRQKFLEKERESYQERVIERVSDTRALSTTDVIQIIDAFVEKFGKAVDEGKVRIDNPTDLNTLARLKEFLLGNADGRTEVTGTVTLEALQGRHIALQRQELEITADIAGEVPALTGEIETETPAQTGARVPDEQTE